MDFYSYSHYFFYSNNIYNLHCSKNNVNEDRKAKPKPKDVERSFSDLLFDLLQLVIISGIMVVIVGKAIAKLLFVCFAIVAIVEVF